MIQLMILELSQGAHKVSSLFIKLYNIQAISQVNLVQLPCTEDPPEPETAPPKARSSSNQ